MVLEFEERGPEAWDREKHTFFRSPEQPYLRMYTKETVDALVTEEAVARKFKRYTFPYNNGRYERHYEAWVEGRQLAVRGLTHAKFVYLHYFMAEEAARNTCSFKESYYNTTRRRGRESDAGGAGPGPSQPPAEERGGKHDHGGACSGASQQSAKKAKTSSPIHVQRDEEPHQKSAPDTPTPATPVQRQPEPPQPRKPSMTVPHGTSALQGGSVAPTAGQLQKVLERELLEVRVKMGQIQEAVESRRRERKDLEKAEIMEAHRLGEINEKLSALAKEKREIMARGGELGVRRQAAADAEARLQDEWKGQRAKAVRAEAELETARQAERAQQELEEAEERVQKKRQALEEKKLEVVQAWQRGNRLQREAERREEAELLERKWREKCDRDDAEAERERQQQAAAEREEQNAMEQEDFARMTQEYNSCTPEKREKTIHARIITSKGSKEAQTLLGKGSWRGAYRKVAFESHIDKGHEAEGMRELNGLKTEIEKLEKLAEWGQKHMRQH